MKGVWQLQEAKNKLSEVVDKAVAEGPQTITRRGRRTAVLMSMNDYARLTRTESWLVEFLRSSPMYGVELDLSRSKDLPREILRQAARTR